MKTRQERFDHMRDLAMDPDVAMTPKELALHLYHLIRFEVAVAKRRRFAAIVRKHADWLNNTEDVYRLRKEMADL